MSEEEDQKKSEQYGRLLIFPFSVQTIGRDFPPAALDPELQLEEFDQNEFFPDNEAGRYGLAGRGLVLVPAQCRAGQPCHLHLHLHGCGMESGWIGENYAQHGGFLPAAQQAGVVLLFPQVKHSLSNPTGCWDWWGYLGDQDAFHYATKEGSQMAGIARMVERAAGIELF